MTLHSSAARLALCAAASLSGTAAMAQVPDVVVDVPPVHSIAARVMEGVGTPELLLPPGTSPHDFALRPSDAGRLADAELVIWAGPGLTPWLAGSLDTLAGGAARLELLATGGWTALPYRTDAAFDDGHGHGADHAGNDGHAHEGGHDDHADHDGHDDHAQGEDHDDHAQGEDHDDHAQGEDHDDHAHEGGHDDHADHDAHDDQAHDHAHDAGAIDPHAWLDPAVAAAWAGHIAEALATADPQNAAAYRANATAAQAEYAALAAEVTARLSGLAGGSFIVPHDAYQYFEMRFGLPAAGAISLTDAGTPGPARIAELRERVAAGGITCVLTDPQSNPEWTALLREGGTAATAQVDPDGTGHSPGPGLYPAIITGMADALADCLG